MATERQSPDVLLELTNLTGTVSEIQDDPDSPDANWLDQSGGNNVDTVVRTSFPTPTGNPTVGADFQEFRAQVRKFGGSGTPTARIELYENGVLVRAGSENNVTGDLVISFTWNANEIGTADGSLVECRVYGTKTGGSPTVRATVEVGAVEWNVVYSAGVVVTPGTASLATTLYTPVLTISDNKTVIPGTLSLATTNYMPSVILGTVVIPGMGTLTATLYTPTVTVSGGDVVVTPGTASLTTTRFTPSIILGTVVTPGVGSLTTTNYMPSVILGTVLVPSVASLTITRYTPTITTTDNKTVIPGLATLTTTRFAPNIILGIMVIPGTLALVITTYAPIIRLGISIVPGTASLILTRYAPIVTVIVPILLTLVSRSFTHSAETRNLTLTLDTRDTEYGG